MYVCDTYHLLCMCSTQSDYRYCYEYTYKYHEYRIRAMNIKQANAMAFKVGNMALMKSHSFSHE